MKIILISVAVVAIPIIATVLTTRLNPLSTWNIKKYKRCKDEHITRLLGCIYWNQSLCRDMGTNISFINFSKCKLTVIKRKNPLFERLKNLLFAKGASLPAVTPLNLEEQTFQEAWIVKTVHGSIMLFICPEDGKTEPLFYTNPGLDIKKHDDFYREVEKLILQLHHCIADEAIEVVYGNY